jgi:hypothetical protein
MDATLQQENPIMIRSNKRTTIHFEVDVYQALEDKAMLTRQSVSTLVNNAVRHMLAGDLEDLAAFGQRTNEPILDLEALLQELKIQG